MKSAELRAAWAEYKCAPGKMVKVPFPGEGRTWNLPVAAEAVPLWEQFADLMTLHGYLFLESAGGTYKCRKIAGTNVYSLHSYGTALDLNPSKNPFKNPLTYDYPEPFIIDVLALKSNGKQAFRWGGTWLKPDAMHWEINVAPEDIDQTVTEGDTLLPLKYRDGYSDGRPEKKEDVILLQELRGVGADGFYGGGTAAAVAPFSGDDGKYVGGATYKKIQDAASAGGPHDHDGIYLKSVKGIT